MFAPGEGSGQGGVEGDRRAGEGLAHGAVRLGVLGGLGEVARPTGREPNPHGEVDARDALAGLEGDVGSGVQRLGGVPACARAWDSAIEKHAEWAAAISSSGLVRPSGSSALEAQVTS